MISNDQLNNIIKDCETAGYTIKVKDISYVMLCRCYDDVAVAYKVIFGGDKSNGEILDFHKSQAITFLREYVEKNFAPKSESVSEEIKPKKRKSKGRDITFDENKDAMIKMLEDTIKKEEDGLIDAKESLNIQTKLRIALNDKFQVKEEVKEQMVIVNVKYNDICEGCGREIYTPTKEDLMEKYNLIENKL